MSGESTAKIDLTDEAAAGVNGKHPGEQWNQWSNESKEGSVAISARMFDAFLKLTMHHLQVETINCYNSEMDKPRYQRTDRLVKYGWRAYSQTDEDGIIEEIFRRVRPVTRQFVEIGTGDGSQCNTAKLLVEGWGGLWIEGYEPHFHTIEKNFGPTFLANGQLRVVGGAVTAENVNEVVGKNTPDEIDLLSIDIDGNDFWIWKALTCQPRVVCIEYNAVLGKSMSVVMPYNPHYVWDGTNYFGASLKALEKLGRVKGYTLVGCNFAGANAFFVRDDLLRVAEQYYARFQGPFTSEEHYEPLRYFAALAIGHTSRPAIYQHIE